MNEMQLLKAFSEIDDKFISEADPLIKKAPLNIYIKFIAACLVLVIISFSAFSAILSDNRKGSPTPISSDVYLNSSSQISSQKEESDNMRGEESKAPINTSSEQNKGEATSSEKGITKNHNSNKGYYILYNEKIYELINKEKWHSYEISDIQNDLGNFVGIVTTNKSKPNASIIYSPDSNINGAKVYASEFIDGILYVKISEREYSCYILETLIKK